MVEGKFSKTEDAYIVDNYQESRDVDIAMRLKRTRESIRMRRKRLGLIKYGAQVTEHLNSDYRINYEIRGLENYEGKMKGVAIERLKELKKKKIFVPPVTYKFKEPLSVKAQAYELYCSGLTIRQVASEMKRNKSVISEWVKLFKPYTGDRSITITIASKI